jgi:hypothetical protein
MIHCYVCPRGRGAEVSRRCAPAPHQNTVWATELLYLAAHTISSGLWSCVRRVLRAVCDGWEEV